MGTNRGLTYRELLSDLDEETKLSIMVYPVIIGADSADMIFFLEDFWMGGIVQPGQEDSVIERFAAWYREFAFDDPT